MFLYKENLRYIIVVVVKFSVGKDVLVSILDEGSMGEICLFLKKVIVVNFILFWKWILVFLYYIYLFKFMWFLKIEIFFFFWVKIRYFFVGSF